MIWYFMLSHSSFRGALQEDTAVCFTCVRGITCKIIRLLLKGEHETGMVMLSL